MQRKRFDQLAANVAAKPLMRAFRVICKPRSNKWPSSAAFISRGFFSRINGPIENFHWVECMNDKFSLTSFVLTSFFLLV